MKSATVKKREALKEKLIWGDTSKIAKLADVNRETVNRWFKGQTNNVVVAAMVEALIKARSETIKSKIAEL